MQRKLDDVVMIILLINDTVKKSAASSAGPMINGNHGSVHNGRSPYSFTQLVASNMTSINVQTGSEIPPLRRPLRYRVWSKWKGAFWDFSSTACQSSLRTPTTELELTGGLPGWENRRIRNIEVRTWESDWLSVDQNDVQCSLTIVVPTVSLSIKQYSVTWGIVLYVQNGTGEFIRWHGNKEKKVAVHEEIDFRAVYQVWE